MRHAVTAAVLALLSAGCGSTPQAAVSPVPVEAPTASVTPTPTPSGPQTVGRTQTNGDAESSMDITVLRLRLPFEGRVRPERAGFVYAGVEVKACVTRNEGELPIGVSWAPWALAYKSGTVVGEASSWSSDGWDEPLYPQDHIVRPGRCVRGWIPFEVRARDGRPELVTYTPSVGQPLEWTVAS